MTMDEIAIAPSGPVSGRIRPPGSKSITNRALVCAALADGPSVLHGALDSEDTRVMIDALLQLGIDVEADHVRRQLRVKGCSGKLTTSGASLYVANSGTTIRFLTALTALGTGTFRLDGNERMRQRPIGDLLDALRQLEVDVRAESENGCPPVIVMGRGIGGGRATMRGDTSSQFLSGLMMVAPYAERGVEIVVSGPLVSQPYVLMTLQVMEAFGVSISHEKLQRFSIPARRKYAGRDYDIEPDASAASYFWAAAAVTGGRVTVEGLDEQSLQGDVTFCRCLEQMGCDVATSRGELTVTGRELNGIDVDMNAISDTVQTLAAVALFANGPTTIRGVAHIRHKETDRIGDLARELRKVGAIVEEFSDGLRIEPGELRPAVLDTYNDHRMAMGLSLVGLRQAGIVIRNPSCTEKTYPRFFDDLKRLCAGRAQQ